MMFKRKTKIQKAAYTKAMMPASRKEVFFDVLKLHYIELVSLGLILFGFALPLIANLLISDMYSAQLSGTLENAQLETEIEQIIRESALVRITSALVSIPLVALLFVGLSGILRVIRQYAWEENVFLFRDFTLGIKQNVKQTALLGALGGCVGALYIYLQSMAELNASPQQYYLASALGAIGFLFLMPISAYMLVCISIYGNTFTQNFAQAFVLYMKAPVKTIAAVLCCFGMLALWAIPNTTLHFALILIFIVLLPTILLGWYLFSYNQLDKYVNSEKHPNLVGKGVYGSTEE